MSKLLSFVKPWIAAALLLLVFKLTGLLSAFSLYSQRLLLESGLLNANVDEAVSKEAFPFDFQLRKTTDGAIVSMTELKGKVIFLNLWATWCGPCRAEMPNIQQLYSTMASDSVVFVMLSIDKKGEDAKVIKYLSDKKFTFTGYRPVDRLPDVLNVPSIPTTFVIDKNGNIVFRKVGTANYNTTRFKNFLKKELEK
jgi:thiol-disulfide isomerase/thioredoxin